MDQSSPLLNADSVALLEKALRGHQAHEKLESAMVLLDHVGADLAAAHVSRAIDALRDRLGVDAIMSDSEQPQHLLSEGS